MDIGSTLSETGGEQPYMYHHHHKGTTTSGNNGHFENWGDSAMAEHSQQTDTSTDIDNEDKNHVTSFAIVSVLLNICCVFFYVLFYYVA